MKREALLQRLQRPECVLKREGQSSFALDESSGGAIEALPRHVESADRLAANICRNLSVPDVK